jgi:pyoverdine/dityrosine biosynthesis protein Dit1
MNRCINSYSRVIRRVGIIQMPGRFIHIFSSVLTQSKIRIQAKDMKRFKDKARELIPKIGQTALVRDPYAGWPGRAPQ